MDNESVVQIEKTRSFLPEDIQNTLMFWREQFKIGYFEIGDTAEWLIGTWIKRETQYTQQDVFDEIGRFLGKSGRTIRYYYETAVFYPARIRSTYDTLPFSHFVCARGFPNWIAVLDYAMEHPTISEEALRRHFLEQTDVSLTIDECDPSVVIADAVAMVHTRQDYLQSIAAMRDGVRAIHEMMAYMSELEKESYSALLAQLEPAVDYLVKIVEKIQ